MARTYSLPRVLSESAVVLEECFPTFNHFQHMVVNGSSARIILIAPDFIEKFISRNDLLGMPRHEFQRLEFL